MVCSVLLGSSMKVTDIFFHWCRITITAAKDIVPVMREERGTGHSLIRPSLYWLMGSTEQYLEPRKPSFLPSSFSPVGTRRHPFCCRWNYTPATWKWNTAQVVCLSTVRAPICFPAFVVDTFFCSLTGAFKELYRAVTDECRYYKNNYYWPAERKV